MHATDVYVGCVDRHGESGRVAHAFLAYASAGRYGITVQACPRACPDNGLFW